VFWIIFQYFGLFNDRCGYLNGQTAVYVSGWYTGTSELLLFFLWVFSVITCTF